MTKSRRRAKKKEEKQIKKNKFGEALRDCEKGTFSSIKKAAAYHKVPYTTLFNLFTKGDTYQGSGRQFGCLSSSEELEIINHVKWRASVGCGVNFQQLQLLIQEVMLAIKQANPARITSYESSNQLPHRMFVRRLAERHNLSLRRSAEISKGKTT